MIIATIIDRAGFNGYIKFAGVGTDRDSAIAALKASALGKTVENEDGDDVELTEEVLDSFVVDGDQPLGDDFVYDEFDTDQ